MNTIINEKNKAIDNINDEKLTKYPGQISDITTQEFIDNTILNQIKQVTNICNELRTMHDPNLKDHTYPESPYPAWVGLSWQKDVGDILKKHYPENFIPIYRDGKEYNSFAPDIDVGLRLCDSIPGVQDEHLNSEGNKVIADSVIRKLKSYV